MKKKQKVIMRRCYGPVRLHCTLGTKLPLVIFILTAVKPLRCEKRAEQDW